MTYIGTVSSSTPEACISQTTEEGTRTPILCSCDSTSPNWDNRMTLIGNEICTYQINWYGPGDDYIGSCWGGMVDITDDYVDLMTINFNHELVIFNASLEDAGDYVCQIAAPDEIFNILLDVIGK